MTQLQSELVEVASGRRDLLAECVGLAAEFYQATWMTRPTCRPLSCASTPEPAGS